MDTETAVTPDKIKYIGTNPKKYPNGKPRGSDDFPGMPPIVTEGKEFTNDEGHIHRAQGHLHLLKVAELLGEEEENHDDEKRRHLNVLLMALSRKYGVTWLPYMLHHYGLRVDYINTDTK